MPCPLYSLVPRLFPTLGNEPGYEATCFMQIMPQEILFRMVGVASLFPGSPFALTKRGRDLEESLGRRLGGGIIDEGGPIFGRLRTVLT